MILSNDRARGNLTDQIFAVSADLCELFYSKFLTYPWTLRIARDPSVSPARLRDFGRSNKRIKPFRAIYDPQMPNETDP